MIEIAYDPTECDLFEDGTTWERCFHRITPVCKWLVACRAKTRKPLDIVYSSLTGKFMLVEWIIDPRTRNDGKGSFLELKAFKEYPGYKVPRISLHEVWEAARPAMVVYEEIMKSHKAQRRAERVELVRDQEFRGDLTNHLKHKGFSTIGAEMGAMNAIDTSRSEYEEAIYTLKEIAKQHRKHY